MWYEIFFEKGRPGTKRTPSTRETESCAIFTNSTDEDAIKKEAQLEMRRLGKKGFHMTSYKQIPVPPKEYCHVIEIPFKPSFKIWREGGQVRQSGWFDVAGVLFEGEPEEAELFVKGFLKHNEILLGSFRVK